VLVLTREVSRSELRRGGAAVSTHVSRLLAPGLR
jgi:hypothetical protein